MTVNTELASAAEQVKVTPDVLGAVTAQALVASTRMPAPDSVMAIPALAAAVMACVGVNEIVAVVCVAMTEEASVIARPLILATSQKPVQVVVLIPPPVRQFLQAVPMQPKGEQPHFRAPHALQAL